MSPTQKEVKPTILEKGITFFIVFKYGPYKATTLSLSAPFSPSEV